MSSTQTLYKLEVSHDDLLHDVQYDFYGRRLAVVSSDKHVSIWDLENEGTPQQQWSLNDKWKAHDASVLRVCWAHPEYGQVIATCSVDRSVRVWEEQVHENKNSGLRWVERVRLVESWKSVQDIKFAPHYMGFKLAVCTAIGMVKIFEAVDVMNLGRWDRSDEFEFISQGKEQDGGHCLSWCPSRFHPPMLVVGCGRDSTAKIFKFKESTKKWIAIEQLLGHEDVVHDVSWAPNVGRSYHLIATACKDRHVRIYKLKDDPDKEKDRLKVELVGNFEDHGAEVWRVNWNLTGTVLSSSGDDGKVRLWKANFLDEWQCIAVINAGDSSAASS